MWIVLSTYRLVLERFTREISANKSTTLPKKSISAETFAPTNFIASADGSVQFPCPSIVVAARLAAWHDSLLDEIKSVFKLVS
jgi:hypothetical protein